MSWQRDVQYLGAPLRRGWAAGPRPTIARRAAPLLAALALTAGAAAWLRSALLDASGLRVGAVHVTGTVRSDAAVIAAATGAVSQNVLGLDLADVRQRVMEQPWVAAAVVRRRLPASVSVTVVEKKAACLERVGDRLDVLDDAGRVVLSGVERRDFALPVVVITAAPAETEAVRAAAAATLAALREREPALFADLEGARAEPGLLALAPRGGPRLLVAGPESLHELSEWLARADELRGRIGDIEQVDARWRGRLWLEMTAAGKG